MPPSRPALERFHEKYKVDPATGCWLWTAALHEKGYGWFKLETGQWQTSAHRAAYRLFVGPIPDGAEVEHRCHTADPDCDLGNACPHRRCVNPDHLEAVSHRENVLRGGSFSAINARKTHCLRGHKFEPGSYYPMPGGGRQCRACRNFLKREHRRLAGRARTAAAVAIPRQRKPADERTSSRG